MTVLVMVVSVVMMVGGKGRKSFAEGGALAGLEACFSENRQSVLRTGEKIGGAQQIRGGPWIRAPSENAARFAADYPTQHRRQSEQEGTREGDLREGGLRNTLGLLNAFCFVLVGAVGEDIR